MANRELFVSASSMKNLPPADTRNAAGGRAYSLTAKHALAQYAVTGCFTQTFYASAEDQVSKVLEYAALCDDAFIAKLAVYARQNGYMKDMPAMLLAILTARQSAYLPATFAGVVDNGKMLRNYVQLVRSGVTGRKSFGTRPRRLIREWLEKQSDAQLFKWSVGNQPSLVDVIKMTHPAPSTKRRETLYKYLLGKEYDVRDLVQLARDFEAFKAGARSQAPDVPFEMLTALPLEPDDWTSIAKHAKWHWTRMNLNTMQRHGVLNSKLMVRMIADRLRDPEEVKASKCFPYQLLAAYKNAHADVPREIKNALQDAMEVACSNIPALPGKVVVCPDVSGSMTSAVTGNRKGATSAVRCLDVAALMSAAILRKNPNAEVMPFDTAVQYVDVNGRDSIMTNAEKLAINGGGTDCASPLRELNRQKAGVDIVIMVSDNESWKQNSFSRLNDDATRAYYRRVHGRDAATTMQVEWAQLKKNNPSAKLVCLDVNPNSSVQVHEASDVLNIGGFSDHVFQLIASFAAGEDSGKLVDAINAIDLGTERA